MLILAIRLADWPLTVVKYPPTKTDRPSGAGWIDSTLPFNCGTKLPLIAPLATSNAKMWLRVIVGPEDSLTWVKLPPTYMVPPIWAKALTPSWRPPSRIRGVPLAGLDTSSRSWKTDGSAAADCTKVITITADTTDTAKERGVRFIEHSSFVQRRQHTVPRMA